MKTHFFATTLLVSAVSFSVSGNAQTSTPASLAKPCTAGGGYQSIGGRPLAKTDSHYTVQPIKAHLGSTSDEIHANFAGIIESNFQYGSSEHILNNLSDRELQDLAKLYIVSTQGNTQPLLKIFAQNLSDKNLVKVAKSFGAKPVSEAVNSYATANVKNAFRAKMTNLESIAAPAFPASELITPMATPTLDMTIPEIYLEFRTAPVGSVGPAAAIAETTMYVSKNVAFAASVGWTIGTGISNLIETYDPSLNEAIGGTVAGMVDASYQSRDLFNQGQYQASFDALFGYPVTNSGNPSGDFGEFEAMDYYWSNVCFN